MSFEKFLFYVFAAILVFAAVMVITRKNPVHSALFLVLAFFNSAGLWMLAEAEFLAIALVLVYVGAVMVLFLFVVMMLDINTAPLREGFTRYLPAGLLVAAVMAAQMIAVLSARNFGFDQFSAPADLPAGYSNTRDVAELLFSKYLMAVQVAALVLIVAVVAALALTLRRREGVRSQDVDAQVAVRKADRLRVVKMPSEKKVPQA